MSASLGDMLVQQGVMTGDQWVTAQEHARAKGASPARSLLELGFATETDLGRVLASQFDMDFVEIGPNTVEHDAVQLLPRHLAEQHLAMPVRFGLDGRSIVVAVADPNNAKARAVVEQATGFVVELVLAGRRPLQQAIAQLSPGTAETASPAAGEAPQRPPSPALGVARTQGEEATKVDLDKLLAEMVEMGGSDLHLTAGIPPAVRVNGDLQHMAKYPVMDGDELKKLLYAIMTQKQREVFENGLELDMSYSVPNVARFRVNVFVQRETIGSVMRVIPFEILQLEQLGLPDQISNFAYLPRGFVLVTGPTGSGKSTTLASIIDMINRTRPVHIMTVEDPIEFLHDHKKAVINQREVGADTHSFTKALKHVLRQDPDVILVGEMRDLETIQIALTAAETGHLVFGTLHTQDAPQTVDRVIDVFPPHQQEQIRVQLAGALQGVVCQTLLKKADGNGRAVATEIMVATSGIRNLIREGKTHQIYSSIQAGAKHGMMAMDQSLALLVKKGIVTYDAAVEKCNNVEEFNRLAGR